MDRELQHVNEVLGAGTLEAEGGEEEAAETRFSSDGPLPGVGAGDGADSDNLSASDRAFGDDDASYSSMAPVDNDVDLDDGDDRQLQSRDSATEQDSAGGEQSGGGAPTASAARAPSNVMHYRGGEPLDYLKNYLQADPPTRAHLKAFMHMMRNAPVRSGAGVRTPISPQDGLAGIITGVVLRICEKYTEVANAKQKRFLRKTTADHLKLLSLPMRRGGHRRRGVVGRQNDGISGQTSANSGVTVNQTAVVLTSLLLLSHNSKFKRQHPRINALYKVLSKDFRQGLLELYPPDKPPSQWRYSTNGRLEDQSHLKTTYEELKKLQDLDTHSEQAIWYHEQVVRIGRAYPEVKKSWEQNDSSVAGSLAYP